MIITMENVSCIMENVRILNNINWNVCKGEHWAIVGLNGSGKTTLLNIINGYIYPSKGEVSVLGRQFGRFDLRELRKSIGWVSSSLQERLYSNETAERIVLSGKSSTIGLYDKPDAGDYEKTHDLLAKLGCAHIVKKKYMSLSQGEKQKVLIARGLFNSPRILILDEPCVGLDVLAREQMLRSIEQLSSGDQGSTILYVTHRIEEILPVFNKTLLLRQGEVYLSGKTVEILTEPNLSGFFKTPINVRWKSQRAWMQII